MAVLYNDQALLVAVGCYGGAWVLGVEGYWIEQVAEQFGAEPYLFPAAEEGDPMDAGHYVWEGQVVVTDPDSDGEVDHDWNGSWRPATLGDFVRFGVAVPDGAVPDPPVPVVPIPSA